MEKKNQEKPERGEVVFDVEIIKQKEEICCKNIRNILITKKVNEVNRRSVWENMVPRVNILKMQVGDEYVTMARSITLTNLRYIAI